MSTPTKPSIVFCHGIWADGSCFNKLIPPLQADGYDSSHVPMLSQPDRVLDVIRAAARGI